MNTFSKQTFWSLLSTTGGVVIPIIQRAYTQGGRGDDEVVAEKGEAFLQYIVNALVSGTPVEADFIFGTTERGKVQPLDGQQRLTTLFLLHWYVAQKEGRLSDAKDTLKKFSYETRASSRYFCESLCEFTVAPSDNRPLPEILEDQGWFVLAWKNDPSVSSMLGMLGRIHKKLHNALPLWDKLTTQTPITFFYTSLEAFNLTDELYIKMNARGKELTSFEKFKAAIEKRIDDGGWDAGKPVAGTFGNQMDNEWTDLFWHFRDTNSHIDRYVLRFCAAVLLGYYAGRDNAKAVRLFSNPESLTSDDLDRESYDYLCGRLHLFQSAAKQLETTVINTAPFFWWGEYGSVPKTFDDLFKLFVARDSEKGGMTWQQLALFHAVTIYLSNIATMNIAYSADWFRFVRNILTNVRVDDIDMFLSAKHRLDEMAAWSCNIYGSLAQATATNGFAGEQMKEECQKARIYQNTPDAKLIIQAIEDCTFCRGHVSFIFECLNINESVPDTDRLEKLKCVALAELNGADISNDFRRALLSIDDHKFYEYWGTTAHPSSCLEAWGAQQFCLIENMADLRGFAKTKRRRYLHRLLESRLQSGLEELVNNFQASSATPRWVVKMIRDRSVLDRDNARYVVIGSHKAWTRQTKKSHSPKEICTWP